MSSQEPSTVTPIKSLHVVNDLIRIQEIAALRREINDPIRENSEAWQTIKFIIKKAETLGGLLECDEDRLDEAIGLIARSCE